ncbi:MAG: hypothetical protein CVU47_03145 [Chloroflexi bacterium HGW-Chloroflexi-9]|nr:MAG: hypothetical protein CVU47_03145 [Chloroflexi bacterium HGW-Chloroflexi-9]
MVCAGCGRDPGDGRFCRFCSTSIVDPNSQLAGLFARFVANIIDGIALWGVLVVAFGFVAAGDAGAALGLLVLIGAFVGWIYLLAKGVTPGKAALGLRVRKTSGDVPGLVTMLLREWIAKYVSALVLYLGYLWAIFDKDRQSWHDKIAGTVVVKVR